VILIGDPALSVTVRANLLRLLRKIAGEMAIPRSRVLDVARTVLANDQNLLADLSNDDSYSVDLR
jgi:hypothetical protein